MDFTKALFPLLIFLGGCCFGPQNSVVKIAYGTGFSTGEIVLAEYFSGFLILAFLLLGSTLFSCGKNGFSIHIPSKKTLLFLTGAGCFYGLIGIAYTFSLALISASLAIILFFQFPWVGVVIQSLAERRLPSRRTVVSVLFLIAGTVIASGILVNPADVNPLGCLLAFAAGVAYAVAMYLMGRAGSEIKPVKRSFFILAIGLALQIIVFSPGVLASGGIHLSIWQFGLLLGCFGCVFPTLLFAVSTPHVPVGAVTILCSSELPASIICAIIILGEGVSVLQWLGIVLIFLGIALPYMSFSKKKKETGL